MSKPSAMRNRLTDKRPLQELTRRQQVAALRTMKAEEVAANVAGHIRDAVKQEVETQLKSLKDTMFQLIDRVVEMEGEIDKLREHKARTWCDEGNSDSGSERAEAPPIPKDNEVVQEPGEQGSDHFSPDRA